MTKFEIELRELLKKYKMEIKQINILFLNNEKSVMEITFEDTDLARKNKYICI